ncbi:hypothetical protein CLOP_g4895 [Closterium sp. NIES-67]|nr:hypothetical protein CLOP_g4895 [Closterium sp. NIES-67]
MEGWDETRCSTPTKLDTFRRHPRHLIGPNQLLVNTVAHAPTSCQLCVQFFWEGQTDQVQYFWGTFSYFDTLMGLSSRELPV